MVLVPPAPPWVMVTLPGEAESVKLGDADPGQGVDQVLSVRTSPSGNQVIASNRVVGFPVTIVVIAAGDVVEIAGVV